MEIVAGNHGASRIERIQFCNKMIQIYKAAQYAYATKYTPEWQALQGDISVCVAEIDALAEDGGRASTAALNGTLVI